MTASLAMITVKCDRRAVVIAISVICQWKLMI